MDDTNLTLLQLEYRNGCSTPELADRYGVSIATIANWLRDLSEPLRSRSAAALNAYQTGRRPHRGGPVPNGLQEGLKAYWDTRSNEHRDHLRRIGQKGNEAKREAARKNPSNSLRDAVCCVCGKIIERKKWRVDRGQRFCCSQPCAGKLTPHQNPAKALPCGWCGRVVFRMPSTLAKTKHRPCCSRSCVMKLTHWRQGHSTEPRPVIMELLRKGADPRTIGADPLEVRSLRGKRRSKTGLKSTQIGPLGEALLDAARKQNA